MAAGAWAHFVKPSLLVADVPGAEPLAPDAVALDWLPAGADTALIVELAALESISMGAALASKGWSVVPMFNTTHDPVGEVLPTWNTLCALRGAAPRLATAASGPPAFLLDARRQLVKRHLLKEGDFDNRWYVFASDFPSEELLRSRGIQKLWVVTRLPELHPDLRDALSDHSGLERHLFNPETGAQIDFPKSRPLPVRLISRFGRGMTRNFNGTFGRRYVSHG
jgi:hypothetical protein